MHQRLERPYIFSHYTLRRTFLPGVKKLGCSWKLGALPRFGDLRGDSFSTNQASVSAEFSSVARILRHEKPAYDDELKL